MTHRGVRAFALVDWDDTLASCSAIFRAAEADLAARLASQLGRDPEELLALARTHGVRAAVDNGITHKTFAEAWLRCYEDSAILVGGRVSAVLSEWVQSRADQVHTAVQQPMPHAEELLRWLRDEGVEVTIWTAGDADTQRAKIGRSALASLIDRCVVTSRKTPATLLQALEGREPARCVVIGNSLRGDVAPALALSMAAVHVHEPTWEYEHLDPEAVLSGYHRADSLDEVPALLRDWLNASLH